MTTALAIVAHHDDHLLWMGGTIRRMRRNGWDWVLIAMCVPDSVKQEFYCRFCREAGVDGYSLGFADNQGGGSSTGMRAGLLNQVGGKKFDWVFTHSRQPSGEYGGHANHSQVQTTVSALVDEGTIGRGRRSLAFFSYGYIAGVTAASAVITDCARNRYLQLTYEELLWKCRLCSEVPDIGSLENLGFPCPNPESFEGDELALPCNIASACPHLKSSFITATETRRTDSLGRGVGTGRARQTRRVRFAAFTEAPNRRRYRCSVRWIPTGTMRRSSLMAFDRLSFD